jgi:hypothetical protein
METELLRHGSFGAVLMVRAQIVSALYWQANARAVSLWGYVA